MKVGEGLYGLRHEREIASAALLRQLLHEIEETGREDRGTEEAKEDTGADEVITHVLVFPFLAALTQTREHLPQLSEMSYNVLLYSLQRHLYVKLFHKL